MKTAEETAKELFPHMAEAGIGREAWTASIYAGDIAILLRESKNVAQAEAHR